MRVACVCATKMTIYSYYVLETVNRKVATCNERGINQNSNSLCLDARCSCDCLRHIYLVVLMEVIYTICRKGTSIFKHTIINN